MDDTEIVSLGKYTFPKILALVTNVEEFLLRLDAKRFQRE